LADKWKNPTSCTPPALISRASRLGFHFWSPPFLKHGSQCFLKFPKSFRWHESPPFWSGNSPPVFFVILLSTRKLARPWHSPLCLLLLWVTSPFFLFAYPKMLCGYAVFSAMSCRGPHPEGPQALFPVPPLAIFPPRTLGTKVGSSGPLFFFHVLSILRCVPKFDPNGCFGMPTLPPTQPHFFPLLDWVPSRTLKDRLSALPPQHQFPRFPTLRHFSCLSFERQAGVTLAGKLKVSRILFHSLSVCGSLFVPFCLM